VFYLDASSPSSYFSPISSTIWKDISGNRITGSLINGPTFNSANEGNFVFDGADDYVSVNGSVTTSTATFISWIKRNGTQGQYDGILFSRSTVVITDATGINFNTSNQLGYHWNGTTSTYLWNSGLTIPDSTWCMCAVAVSTSSATAYLGQSSGITTSTNNVSHTSSTLSNILVARDSFESRYFNGNIAIAQIYNRALSAQEVLQNYNATKTRFGL
jgi:hypothetical protein